MKSYDNTIKYYELLMYYKDTAIYKKYSLPDGFHFEFYKDGNMNDWINIHIESGEFCAIEEGIMIFHDFYDTFIQELNKDVYLSWMIKQMRRLVLQLYPY